MKRPACFVVAAGILGAILYLLYSHQSVTYHHHRRALWDVYAALIYYMEDNGSFPDSEVTLLASGFVTTQDDGSFVVQERTTSDYAPYTYSEPIRDLGLFRIRWGADLSTMRVQDEATVLEDNGHPVLLINYSAFHLNREYTSALLKAYQELTGRKK